MQEEKDHWKGVVSCGSGRCHSSASIPNNGGNLGICLPGRRDSAEMDRFLCRIVQMKMSSTSVTDENNQFEEVVNFVVLHVLQCRGRGFQCSFTQLAYSMVKSCYSPHATVTCFVPPKVQP
jgi:hypothetical protein